jgi:hypothetical protein
MRNQKPAEPRELALQGRGRYSSLRLYLGEGLKRQEEELAEDLSAHFSAGYRWLEAHVVGELLAVEFGMTIELYMELRSALTAKLADLVAVYGMNSRAAFYLLDPRAVQTALDRATASRGNIDSSPIELTTMLVTQLLDPEETVARMSLAEGRPLELKLEDSRYAATGLNLAEGAFYDTSRVVSFPLVREGRVQLTAVFPAALQWQIEPKLHIVAGRCAEIVNRQRRFAANRLLSTRSSLAVDAGGVAEVFGRFAGGFTDSLT